MTLDPELDALYNNRAAVPEHPAIFERWRNQSTRTRADRTCRLDLPYGAHPLQSVDLFPAAGNRGLAVFIHGGYWRSLDKADFSLVAEPLLDAGINVALLNYRLCPAVGVADVVEDCRDGVCWLADNAADHGINIDNTALLGHSAGGHLVAMLYATDWVALGVDPDIFRGGVALSGLYGLEPLLRTSVNADLKLDADAARTLSPIHLSSQLDIPLDIIVGADETAEFIRQSRLLHGAWPRQASPADVIEGYNHFTIVDHYVDPASPAMRRTLRFFEP